MGPQCFRSAFECRHGHYMLDGILARRIAGASGAKFNLALPWIYQRMVVLWKEPI